MAVWGDDAADTLSHRRAQHCFCRRSPCSPLPSDTPCWSSCCQLPMTASAWRCSLHFFALALMYVPITLPTPLTLTLSLTFIPPTSTAQVAWLLPHRPSHLVALPPLQPICVATCWSYLPLVPSPFPSAPTIFPLISPILLLLSSLLPHCLHCPPPPAAAAGRGSPRLSETHHCHAHVPSYSLLSPTPSTPLSLHLHLTGRGGERHGR